jgi:hypothetical protein
MQELIYIYAALFYAGVMIWLPFYFLDSPHLAAALHVFSFILALLAILINHANPSTDPILKKRQGFWILLLGLLGLPWVIVLKITRQDTLVKKAVLFIQLVRLPVCHSSRVLQMLDDTRNPEVFQSWLETRTLMQVLNRYAQDSAIRDGGSLRIRPSHSWQSGYFTMNSSISRIEKNAFLDHSTHTISS